MNLINLSDITISPSRQRKELDADDLNDLASSISSIGLIHPIVIRYEGGDLILVAGERRLKAVDLLHNMGQSFTHGGKPVPDGKIPCTSLKDLDPLDAMEIELEENIRRVDLTWQDRSQATAQLYELRRLQAEKAGREAPSVTEFSKEVYPDQPSDKSHGRELVRQELILARHLKDPEVAAAKTAAEGIKVIRRKEEIARNEQLSKQVGKLFSAADHTLFHKDCLEAMRGMYPDQFDVILTDPPYGIDAQNFNDSGGKADASGHSYDDSYDNWLRLMGGFLPLTFRLAKPQAHLYIFCDVDNFIKLRTLTSDAGWQTFRTPFVWHNPSSQRAPWPTHGPHRRHQLCLYAVKGERPVLKLASDTVTYASDENLGWAAQKPVALYQDFLSRSCRAGDSVLDAFCGSGTIFPAAHALKVKATGIEQDANAYGIAVKRLGLLK